MELENNLSVHSAASASYPSQIDEDLLDTNRSLLAEQQNVTIETRTAGPGCTVIVDGGEDLGEIKKNLFQLCTVIQPMETSNEHLTEENAKLMKRLQQRDIDIEHLKDESLTLAKHFDEKQIAMEQLKDENAFIFKQLQERDTAIEHLKEENATFTKQLQLKDIASEHLKAENETLTKQLDCILQENCDKTEKLEQECYSLRMKLDCQVKMVASYEEEIVATKTTLSREYKERIATIERENTEKMMRVTQQLNDFELERTEAHMSYSYLLREKQDALAEVMRLHDELQQQTLACNELSTDEIVELNNLISALKEDKAALQKEVNNLRNADEQQKQLISSLRDQLRLKEIEIEDRQCLATSYYNILERTREEMQELKVELDLAKMDANKLKKKGNSLFSEVEDRRVEAEKQLISVKIHCESLKRQLELTRQNLHSVKMQMAGLLQASSVQADIRHMDNLTTQLSQANGEVETLTTRLHEYEQREKVLRERLVRGGHCSNGTSEVSQDVNNRIQFLQALILQKETEMAQVQQELKTKRLLLLAETDKLTACERKLYAANQCSADLNAQNVKLRLMLEELKLKYEPDAVVTGTLRKVKMQQIAIEPQAMLAETKASSSLSSAVLTNSDTIDLKNCDSQRGEVEKSKSTNIQLPGYGLMVKSNKENAAPTSAMFAKSTAIQRSDMLPKSDSSSVGSDDVFLKPSSSALKRVCVPTIVSSVIPNWKTSFTSSFSGASVKPPRRVRMSEDVEILGTSSCSSDNLDSTTLSSMDLVNDVSVVNVSGMNGEQSDCSNQADVSIVADGGIRGRQKGGRTIIVEHGSSEVDGCKTQ